MDKPLYRHASEVSFRDTDASGWLHFTNIFTHVEIAEHAFLRSRGLLVFDRSQGGWPRVKVACEYQHPLLCGDKIEVQLAIAALGTASVTWNFEVINAAGELAAHGSITTVRVNHLGRPQPLDATERTHLKERGL
ncbi:MAG: acyl-CoA thioesterase [Verrucomicrobia bacterium]|nr:acyl-CoA thioesterase [Verrucomicrobiota bacterium]